MPVFTERRCGQLIDPARKSVSLKGHRVFPIPQLTGSSPGEHQRRESLSGSHLCLSALLAFDWSFPSHMMRGPPYLHVSQLPCPRVSMDMASCLQLQREVTEHETKRKLLQKHQELQFESEEGPAEL